MSNITVKFIGKEYTVPEDILTYIDLLNFTDNIQKRLSNAFVRKLKSEINSGNVACLDDKVMAPDIEQQVGKFIAKLTEYGIYDRTINDYLRENEGYKLISKVNAAALEEAKRVFKQQISDWIEGYEDAIQKKDASVTGLSFSILSGSFVNHAIYAAMEASKVNEQEKAATKEYQKDMAELDARLASRKNEDEKRYIANTYIPHMEAAISVFSYELLDTFISDLIKYGKLNKDLLNYVHIDRSNDLLKNLELSQNKEAVLLKAFEACPYNIAVYMQAMKYDLLDYDSFQTAKLFKHGSTIISFLEENLGGTPDSEKRRLNFKNAELLSMYSGRSLREITSYVADFIVDGYAQTIAAFTNNTPCYNIMNKVDERDILAGDSISKQKSDWLVDPLAPAVLWDKLTSEYGHTDLFDRLLSLLPDRPEMNNKQEYDAFLKNRLFTIFEIIRQERGATILAQRQEDARKKEAEAEKARLAAERNRKIKKICFVAAIVVIVIAIASTIITKVNNTKAYQEMAGEFCVYRVINDDGEEIDEFNWWISIGEDGTMKMSSWSYAIEDCEVDSYSGTLKNKADFKKFKDYRIEDYGANVSEYEEALYCYEFHIADEWDELDGYIVCWQYQNGKAVDVYCDDYRYSFVETGSDYSFKQWLDESDSDRLSGKVQNIIDNLDVSEDDAIERIEQQFNDHGYDDAVEALVTSKLSDEQKMACYESLVDRTDFTSFEVNGLVFHIPEHWHIRDYSDPNISGAEYPKEDSPFALYVKYLGTAEQVANEEDDYWKTRNDFSGTTIPGCTNAYVRFDSGHNNKGEQYFVIEHFVECDGQVYQIQFLAYDGRYYEPEVWMLLDRVEFTNYAENRATWQEQTYLNATDLFNNGKYAEALSVFETIVGYKDSGDKITECNTAIAEKEYANAVTLINEGDYVAAYDVLIKLNNFPDAVKMLKNFKWVPTESTYVPAKSSESNSYHSYTYNDDGVLVKEVINDSTVVTYSYDPHGNMILKKYTYSDGDTSQYEYKYNTANQLVQERYTYPDGSVDVVNYTYDSNGRISEAEDIHWGNFNQRLTYSYDAEGKLVKKDTIDHFDSVGCYEYEYDEYEQLTKEIHTTDIGESYSVVYTTEYSYLTDGYLIKISEYKDGRSTGYELFDEWIVFYSSKGFFD